MSEKELNEAFGFAPPEMEESDRQWIVARYGPVTTCRRSVLFEAQALAVICVAAVPVTGGIAIGAGPTEDDAIRYLRMDLSGVLEITEIPL
jgi:hypothetical protein